MTVVELDAPEALARPRRPVREAERRVRGSDARPVSGRRVARFAPDLVAAVWVLVVARARYRIIANGAGLTGFDPGNWLAFANSMLGDGVRSSQLSYPPAVPLLTKLFVELWGPTVGLARLAALVSILPAIGVYLVVRSSGARWVAVFVAGLIAASAAVGEATAWGGYPQLIGLGLLPLVLWRWDAFLSTRSRRDSLVTGALLSAGFATSHFLAATAVVGMAALAVGHLSDATSRPLLVRAWRRWLLVALPVVPLVPMYVTLGGAISGNVSSRNGRFTDPLAPERFRELDFLARESPTLWKIVFLTLPLALVLLARRRTQMWRIAAAGLVATVVTMVLLGDPRVVYVYPTFAVMGLAMLLDDLVRRSAPAGVRPPMRGSAVRAALAFALLVTLAVHTSNGVDFFRIQRSYYGIVTPPIEESLDWVRNASPRGAVIATPPINDGPWGWWIEGLGERKSLVGSSLQWLNYTDEQQRATESAAIFASFPSLDSLAVARSDGAGFLLVPSTSSVYDDATIDAFVNVHPELLVFRNDTVVILRVTSA